MLEIITVVRVFFTARLPIPRGLTTSLALVCKRIFVIYRTAALFHTYICASAGRNLCVHVCECVCVCVGGGEGGGYICQCLLMVTGQLHQLHVYSLVQLAER